MLRVRFRIRTIMIVIATLAVVMGLIMNAGVVAATAIVLLVASLVEFSAFSFHLSRGRTRAPQFLRKANRQFMWQEPARSWEPKRV